MLNAFYILSYFFLLEKDELDRNYSSIIIKHTEIYIYQNTHTHNHIRVGKHSSSWTHSAAEVKCGLVGAMQRLALKRRRARAAIPLGLKRLEIWPLATLARKGILTLQRVN